MSRRAKRDLLQQQKKNNKFLACVLLIQEVQSYSAKWKPDMRILKSLNTIVVPMLHCGTRWYEGSWFDEFEDIDSQKSLLLRAAPNLTRMPDGYFSHTTYYWESRKLESLSTIRHRFDSNKSHVVGNNPDWWYFVAVAQHIERIFECNNRPKQWEPFGTFILLRQQKWNRNGVHGVQQ